MAQSNAEGQAPLTTQQIAEVGRMNRVADAINLGQRIVDLEEAANPEVTPLAAGEDRITNTTTETLFANYYEIDTDKLVAGAQFEIESMILLPSTNGTNTVQAMLYLGGVSGGLDLGEIAAFDPADDDVMLLRGVLTFLDVSNLAAAVVCFNGTGQKETGGSNTAADVVIVGETVDISSDSTIGVAITWSVANAANQADQRLLRVKRNIPTASA